MKLEDLFDGKWHDLWYARDIHDRRISNKKMTDDDSKYIGYIPITATVFWLTDYEDREVIDVILGPGFHGLRVGKQRKIRIRLKREVDWK